jgi:hypothetical protein
MSGRTATAALKSEPNKAPAAIDALALRAWARAYLWAAVEIENIPNAVDPLQTFAVETGLVADIGQDAVQKILDDAFVPYRRETPSADDAVLFCNICFRAPCFTPVSCNLCREDQARRRVNLPITSKSKKQPTPRPTIEAIMWCVRERGPKAQHESASRGLKVATGRPARAHLKCRGDDVRQALGLGKHGSDGESKLWATLPNGHPPTITLASPRSTS